MCGRCAEDVRKTSFQHRRMEDERCKAEAKSLCFSIKMLNSDGMKVGRIAVHVSLAVNEPFMNSRIRRMLVFLHRGSKAQVGRKTAEEFSASIHCFRGKC